MWIIVLGDKTSILDCIIKPRESGYYAEPETAYKAHPFGVVLVIVLSCYLSKLELQYLYSSSKIALKTLH